MTVSPLQKAISELKSQTKDCKDCNNDNEFPLCEEHLVLHNTLMKYLVDELD